MRAINKAMQGKTTFFVVNQANIEAMPPAQIAILEAELKSTNEEIKALAAEIKAATAGEYLRSYESAEV
jgi:26S proteasome regulatory subunit (ATPase 3-interacting protein)